MATWKDFIEKKARMTDGSHPSVLENDPAYGLYGKPATPADAEAMAQNANAMARQRSGNRIQEPVDWKGIWDVATGTDPKNAYKRGRFIRGLGKGFVELPGQLPGYISALTTGLAAKATGDTFREGWQHGYGMWDRYAGQPWHRFVRWASTPIRSGYDKAHAELADEVRRAEGDEAARKLVSESELQDGLGEMTGGMLGAGAAHKALRALGSGSRAAATSHAMSSASSKAMDVARRTGRAYETAAYVQPMIQQRLDIQDDLNVQKAFDDMRWDGISPEDEKMLSEMRDGGMAGNLTKMILPNE